MALLSATYDTVLANTHNMCLQGRIVLLATWHLPGVPVGPSARWAATSNVQGESGTEDTSARKGGLYLDISFVQGTSSS